MTIKMLTVAGGGVLGSQIAYQAAYKGFPVTIYDINEDALNAARKRVEALQSSYQTDLNVNETDFKAGVSRLTYTSDLAKAVKQADLVIEAIPENLDLKTKFYQQISELAPATAIFSSNSSSLLPSQLAPATSHPERLLNMHFANHIWVNNTAEIMGSPKTDPEVYREVVAFAKAIGMIPIQLKKEHPSYILNSLLTPLMVSGMSLWVNGVADPQTIDKTWMLATGAEMGPFAILDMIGARTLTAVPLPKTMDPDGQITAKLKQRLADGKLGMESGEGFYRYPNPEFQQPDFLKA
ncbi:MAG TPA: 3-hydroxyacyl-CoA dehydrogenase [Lactobacillus sp.]|nr:3-hydroxyacyl-CoA dehydrogenase [Lactobacillus sp.]